jgi:hypothetical protein
MRLLMNQVRIDLEHCYGIKKLNTTLDFSKKPVVVLYAQNGDMKTSLAETFLDLSKGKVPSDRIVPSHTTVCTVLDENGTAITPESIFVIRPLDEEFRPGEQVSTLLVNMELSREYSQLLSDRDMAKNILLDAVKKTSKSERPLEQEISKVITRRENEFFSAIVRIREELRDQIDTPFVDVEYDKLFDQKGIEALAGKDVANEINSYVDQYNRLLTQSLYFKKGTFDYYNAGKIAKALADNGFFTAAHSLNLKSHTNREIKSVKDLEAVVDEEKAIILADKTLKAAFDKVAKVLAKNEGLREFESYLMNHEDYLSQLGDVETFKEKVLKSYLKEHYGLYEELLSKHEKVAAREKAIRQEAISQTTLWSQLIDTFNSRFFVPFRLVIENQAEVMLEREGIKLGFIYKDNGVEIPIEEKSLLKCLSQGEKRAFYILQVLFEVSIRRKKNLETLLVIDDIADSFDYQNKYAILHYLLELSQDPLFKQIIMTHNFDFFRSIVSRVGVRDNSFIVSRGNDSLILKEPEGINNPFVNIWKAKFFKEDTAKIASICFLRNLIEYTVGVSDANYKTLTSLLHWKTDSSSITIGKLDDIYKAVCAGSGTSSNPDRFVIDVILSSAATVSARNTDAGLEEKVLLSIASRLVAEKYMISKINDPAFLGTIKKYQTQVLLTKFRLLFPTSPSMVALDRVALMTPENIHLNSFMFEPIMDMSDQHLRELYISVSALV